jgi:hypothetical protein
MASPEQHTHHVCLLPCTPNFRTLLSIIQLGLFAPVKPPGQQEATHNASQ